MYDGNMPRCIYIYRHTNSYTYQLYKYMYIDILRSGISMSKLGTGEVAG